MENGSERLKQNDQVSESATEGAPDLSRFNSSDPHEVLGISTDATPEVISAARKSLQRQFHPDVNKAENAKEIAQNINAAADALLKGEVYMDSEPAPAPAPSKETIRDIFYPTEETRKHSPFDPYSLRKESPERTREIREELKAWERGEVEKTFLSNLRESPERFADWVRAADSVGITHQRREELLGSEEAKQTMLSRLKKEVQSYGIANPHVVLDYIRKWLAVGIELGDMLRSPEVHDMLVKDAITYRIEAGRRDAFRGEQHKDADDAEAFLELVGFWKMAGVDLSDAITDPKVTAYLEERAIKKAVYGRKGPKEFLEFVTSWKKAGVDLSSTVNAPEAKKYLGLHVYSELLRIKHSTQPDSIREELRAFIKDWVAAGWDASEEARSFLESA